VSITDEELADIERHLEDFAQLGRSRALALVAALRESRAERDDLMQKWPFTEQFEALIAERDRLRAFADEVKGLIDGKFDNSELVARLAEDPTADALAWVIGELNAVIRKHLADE